MKKKKGSSLIFVLVTFAAITTFALSILSVTLVSYKKKLIDVREKRNQYFSEAGIDIAYGIIGKTLDEATKKGNTAVQQRIANAVTNNDNVIKSDGTIDEDKIKETFNLGYNDVNSNQHYTGYREYIQNNIMKNIQMGFLDENGIRENNYSSTDDKDTPLVRVVDGNGTPLTDESGDPVTGSAANIVFSDDNSFALNIQSTFATDRILGNPSSGTVKKIIGVKYSIGTVKYNQVYAVKTSKIPLNSVWQKAICADGSSTVQGDFSVNGNMYVQGLDSSGVNNGGISIQQGSVTFNGIVATNGNFKILGIGNTVNVNGNVYADNISIEGTNTTLSVNPINPINSANYLAGAVYTNNDFEISGKKSNITIRGGFYGVNDRNDTEVSGDAKPKLSSSILINTDDDDITNPYPNGTKLEIQNKLLLMGVGYARTTPQYQTGESVAIKGNYKAYLQSLLDDVLNSGRYKSDNVYFEYRSPLTLVRGYKDTNGNMTDMLLNDKSDYFKSYDAEHKNDEYKLNTGGNDNIIFPQDTISIGTIAANGQIGDSQYSPEAVNPKSLMLRKQNKYSKAVYKMSNISDTSAEDDLTNTDYDHDENDDYKYDRENNVCTVTVANQVNFTKSVVKKIDDNRVICLNQDQNSTCNIIGHGDTVSLSLGGGTTLDGIQGGVIVTKGDVHLSGTINNFKGTIISLNNIIVDDTQTKKITYDASYVKRIIGDNYESFNGIFNTDPSQNDDYAYKDISNDSVNTDVIRDKSMITMKNWKIIK